MNTETAKKKLEAERNKLESEMEAIGQRNPSVPNDFEATPNEKGKEADIGDQADHVEGFEENTSVMHELEVRYSEVLAALEQIKDGTYGTCDVCGEPISEARLAANPAATTCAAHA